MGAGIRPPVPVHVVLNIRDPVIVRVRVVRVRLSAATDVLASTTLQIVVNRA
jgi:hypothetical protein